MKLYKVLKRVSGRLRSPFQDYEYKPGKEYTCKNFNADVEVGCSYGYYATELEGLIYSFCDSPEYEIWEVEVGGRRVEIDQFKRRYERIRLLRRVPLEEVKKLALAEEEKVGYKLAEVLFPIHPLRVKARLVTEAEIGLLKDWGLVWDLAWASIRDSAWDSVRVYIWDSVRSSVGNSVWDSVRDSIRSIRSLVRASAWDSVRVYIWDSVWASVGAYIFSLFPGIADRKCVEHSKDITPYQPCIDLWRRGFVPSFDGEKWRLHAGEEAEIVWEGALKEGSQ